MVMKKIELCVCDEGTPLIWTFKFAGAEYWCPLCGRTYDMFGAGNSCVETRELKRQSEKLKKKAAPFLRGDTDKWEYLFER